MERTAGAVAARYCLRRDNQPGNITVLITWMMPFDCMTSPIVIWAISPLPSISHSLHTTAASSKGETWKAEERWAK
jgi:hypothetical protein